MLTFSAAYLIWPEGGKLSRKIFKYDIVRKALTVGELEGGFDFDGAMTVQVKNCLYGLIESSM